MNFYLLILITYVCIESMKAEVEQRCRFSAWTEWSDCTLTCGNGTRTRKRTPIESSENCKDTSDSGTCNRKCCPVDCQFNYTDWSECNGCMGEDGIQHRKLMISHKPFCGGKECPTQERIEQSCQPKR